MKRLLNKDEMRYKKEIIKEEAKTQKENSGDAIPCFRYDKGIPGSYINKRK